MAKFLAIKNFDGEILTDKHDSYADAVIDILKIIIDDIDEKLDTDEIKQDEQFINTISNVITKEQPLEDLSEFEDSVDEVFGIEINTINHTFKAYSNVDEMCPMTSIVQKLD